MSSEFDDSESQTGSSELPESISITRIDDLLDQMRFHEVPKRALFSVSLQLAPDFCIGVKGYGLVAEQRKGAYKYFADLGDRMEVAESRTAYVDEASMGQLICEPSCVMRRIHCSCCLVAFYGRIDKRRWTSTILCLV